MPGNGSRAARLAAPSPDKPADPIIVHPDVRRMLLTMRALTEGGRALACWLATEIDVADHHPDAGGAGSRPTTWWR